MENMITLKSTVSRNSHKNSSAGTWLESKFLFFSKKKKRSFWIFSYFDILERSQALLNVMCARYFFNHTFKSILICIQFLVSGSEVSDSMERVNIFHPIPHIYILTREISQTSWLPSKDSTSQAHWLNSHSTLKRLFGLLFFVFFIF